MKQDGPSERSGKSSSKLPPGSTSSITGDATPEVVARLILKGHLNQPRSLIRGHSDPGMFSLQVGLALGVMLDNPLKGYHVLRKILSGAL